MYSPPPPPLPPPPSLPFSPFVGSRNLYLIEHTSHMSSHNLHPCFNKLSPLPFPSFISHPTQCISISSEYYPLLHPDSEIGHLINTKRVQNATHSFLFSDHLFVSRRDYGRLVNDIDRRFIIIVPSAKRLFFPSFTLSILELEIFVYSMIIIWDNPIH